jgi:AcrR family transcriptional regulator
MVARSAALNQRLRDESRQAIRHAALEAFAELGYHGASMAEIARRAGVSKALIYQHVPSKEDLLRTSWRTGWSRACGCGARSRRTYRRASGWA